MNNNDFNDDIPEFNPSQIKRLEISKDEIDYLSDRWEVRDTRDLFSWSINLLYDLSKLDEMGWRLAIQKCEFEDVNKKMIIDKNYNTLIFMLEWLAPRDGAFMRMPPIEVVEKMTKIEKTENK